MGTSGSGIDQTSGRRRGTPIIWSLAIVLGAVAIVSAFYGWWIHDGRLGPPRDLNGVMDWLDLPVRGVQALLLSDIYFDDRISEDAERWLQIARISGALFSLLVAGRLLFKALGDSILQRSLRRRRGHVVIFGDGPATSDFVGLPEYGQVTQVAQGLEFSPGRFAHLPADGTLAEQAASSAAGRASRLLVNEESDEKTWQSAMALARHVRDVDVIAILGGLAHSASESRLRSISFSDGVARQILLAHPPYLLAKAIHAPRQHILIIGFGPIGQAILREFLVTSPVTEPAGMMITVVASDVLEVEPDFMARHPDLGMAVDLKFIEGDFLGGDAALSEQIRRRQSGAEFCAAYLTTGEFGSVAGQADMVRNLAIRHNLFRSPIFFFSDDGAGLANVRHGSGLLGPSLSDDAARAEIEARADVEGCLCELRTIPFGTWRDALDGAGLLAPDLDAQAKMFHASYLAIANPGGIPVEQRDLPANRTWELLEGDYRVSNRRAAAHIRAKVFVAGFDLDGWLKKPRQGRLVHELPPAASCFDTGDSAFVARMSELEHIRWMCDRLLNGWSSGPERNNFRKIHNMLRPFSEIGEAEKQKDTANLIVTRQILEMSALRR